jgi:hypothetical protein
MAGAGDDFLDDDGDDIEFLPAEAGRSLRSRDLPSADDMFLMRVDSEVFLFVRNDL